MTFENLEWAEYKDEMYEKLFADTQGELWWLKSELFPLDVDNLGNYKDGAFDEYTYDENKFSQDALG